MSESESESESELSPQAKIKNSEATFVDLPFFFYSAKTVSIAVDKKLNSMERGAFFWLFSVSKMITTAHAHKSDVNFQIFPKAFKQKKLRLYDQRCLV